MTLATEKRIRARIALLEWVQRQIAAHREPDGYMQAEEGDDLAYWCLDHAEINAKPVFVMESGILVYWCRYYRTTIDPGFIFDRVYTRAYEWFVSCPDEEDDEAEDPRRYPDLHARELSLATYVTYANHAASLP